MEVKNIKGITLIALVITIIVLLILAGVTIATLTGENGILNKANIAKEETKRENAREKIQLAIMSYQIDKEKTTLYDELIKIDGLTYITPDNRNDGPKYNVIVDGYEFVINEDLQIEYVKENKDSYIPQITKIEYETEEVETLIIAITSKTEDQAGLKEIRVSYKKVEDDKIKYETIKTEKVTGKEANINVEIPINGDYVIEAIGENGQIGKKEIVINNIKQGSILTTITQGTINEQAQVVLNIRGQSQGIAIKAMELFVGDKKINTYQYDDLKTIREETYTLNDLEFYKQNNCYVKVIDNNNKVTNSAEETVINTKIIKTATDLRNLSKQVNLQNNSFKDKTIYLMDNIDVGENWEPIGYWDKSGDWAGKYFAGTFEGNDKNVTILSCSKDTIYQSSGLFGMVIGGTVKKLTVNGIIDANVECIGGIAGAIKNGSIENCNNNSTITNTTNNYHGGITGAAENSNIQNCTNMKTIYGNSAVGGICGRSISVTISNCSNSELIKCYGVMEVVSGNITAQEGMVGGIVGYTLQNSLIEHCTNTGEITGNAQTILPKGICGGGIIGWTTSSTITTSKNTALVHYDVTSDSIHNVGTLGGIVGSSVTSTIEQSFNTGTVTSKYNNKYGMDLIGGVVGTMNASTAKNVYNVGEVYGDCYVGGVIGSLDKDYGLTENSYIYNCYNASDKVEGNTAVGNSFGRCRHTIGSAISCLANKTTIGQIEEGCSFDEENTAVYMLYQMQVPNSDLFILLNKGYGNGIWTQGGGKNNGLPYLINNQP